MKSETEITIEKKNLPEFLSITSDIVSCVKQSNNIINNKNTTKKKIIHKDSTINNKKAKQPIYNTKAVKVIRETKTKNTIDQEEKIKTSRILGGYNNSEISKLNFNKIINLNTQPGKFKITGKDIISSNSNTETSINENKQNKQQAYLSLNEVIHKVNALTMKRHLDKDLENEEVGRMLNNVYEAGSSFKKQLEQSKEEHFSSLSYR